jgi:hypothetical protein
MSNFFYFLIFPSYFKKKIKCFLNGCSDKVDFKIKNIEFFLKATQKR